jgi:hypothetical protein
LFFPGSRYADLMRYQKRSADGNIVQVTQLPLPGPPVVLGLFRRTSGQRLDLIANRFLADATSFWRLCDANNAMVPDALGNRELVGIPIDAPVRS